MSPMKHLFKRMIQRFRVEGTEEKEKKFLISYGVGEAFRFKYLCLMKMPEAVLNKKPTIEGEDEDSIIKSHNSFLDGYFRSLDLNEECSLIKGMEDLKMNKEDVHDYVDNEYLSLNGTLYAMKYEGKSNVEMLEWFYLGYLGQEVLGELPPVIGVIRIDLLVKEVYKEYIGMVKVYYEEAKRSRQEEPRDVAVNCRGTAGSERPQDTVHGMAIGFNDTGEGISTIIDGVRRDRESLVGAGWSEGRKGGWVEGGGCGGGGRGIEGWRGGVEWGGVLFAKVGGAVAGGRIGVVGCGEFKVFLLGVLFWRWVFLLCGGLSALVGTLVWDGVFNGKGVVLSRRWVGCGVIPVGGVEEDGGGRVGARGVGWGVRDQDKQEIIHRDIKSANILLGDNWKAKIADFGLSKFHPVDQDASTFNASTIAGTPMYFDPEYEKSGKLNKKSDIYSFGVVLFEILTGRLAYDFDKGIAPIARHHFEKGILMEIVDHKIKEETNEHVFSLSKGPNEGSLDTFSKIAIRCLAVTQVERPSIDVVINELKKALYFQVYTMGIYSIVPQPTTINYLLRGRIEVGEGEADIYDRAWQILMELDMENDNCSEVMIVFTWVMRLKICLDIANKSGWEFLHGTVSSPQIVIHRDISSSNILLFDDWKAKITDFGFSLVCPTNQDVGSVIDKLGAVLLDILCGKLSSIELDDEYLYLPFLAKQHYHVGKLDKRERRPTASEVILQLKKALEFQEDYEIWEPKLSKDYKEIIQMSKCPEDYFTIKKEDLYNIFSKGILLQQDKVRDEEWMMIELYQFMNQKDDVMFTFLLESFSSYYFGESAIYVEGIEFRAINKVRHENIIKLMEGQQVLKSNFNLDQVQQLPTNFEEIFKIHRNYDELFWLGEVNGKKLLVLSAKATLYKFSDISLTDDRYSIIQGVSEKLSV
ncbi:kinase-like domain, phloem protein 2-like protein [Tanacetum coccineum]